MNISGATSAVEAYELANSIKQANTATPNMLNKTLIDDNAVTTKTAPLDIRPSSGLTFPR